MQAAEVQSQVLMVLLVFSLIIYFMTQFDWTSKYMFVLVRSLQIVIHFPVLRVILQANIIRFFQIILPLLQFDFVDQFLDWDEVDFIAFNDGMQLAFEEEIMQ